MEVDKPIAIAIILFIILALSIYLVLPKYHLFQDLLTQIGQKEAEFESKDAYFIEVTRTYQELMQYQDSLAKIDIAIPEKLSLASLVNLLRVKAEANGLIFPSVSVSKITDVGKDTKVKETTLSVSLIGSYLPFKNFLASLESSARLIEIQSFSFNVALPSQETAQAPVKTGKPVVPPKLVMPNYPISLTIKVYSY